MTEFGGNYTGDEVRDGVEGQPPSKPTKDKLTARAIASIQGVPERTSGSEVPISASSAVESGAGPTASGAPEVSSPKRVASMQGSG